MIVDVINTTEKALVKLFNHSYIGIYLLGCDFKSFLPDSVLQSTTEFLVKTMQYSHVHTRYRAFIGYNLKEIEEMKYSPVYNLHGVSYFETKIITNSKCPHTIAHILQDDITYHKPDICFLFFHEEMYQKTLLSYFQNYPLEIIPELFELYLVPVNSASTAKPPLKVLVA